MIGKDDRRLLFRKAQGQTLNMEYASFPVLILKFSLVFLRIHMRNAALFTALILTPNSSPTALFVKPEGAEINSPLCAEINPLPPDYESQQDYGIDI